MSSETSTRSKPKKVRNKLIPMHVLWSTRASKCDPETARIFEENLSIGMPIDQCCAMAGIVPDTFYKWMDFGYKYLTDPRPYEDHVNFGQFYSMVKKTMATWQKEILLRSFTSNKYCVNWMRDMTLLERRDRTNWSRSDTVNVRTLESEPDLKFL